MRKEFYEEYYRIETGHWWFVGRRRILLNLLNKYLPTTPRGATSSILDVGCGTGAMLPYLAHYGDVQGIDASPEAVQFSRERGLHNVQQANGLELPFDDSCFDLVTALDVVEHIDDEQLVLREMFRVLRPGGTLLVSVPAYNFLWGPQDEISHHKRRYTARKLVTQMEKAGFRCVKLSYFNTFLFPIVAVVRILKLQTLFSRELRSDCGVMGQGRLNGLLALLFSLEALLVSRFDLPFGVSIVGLMRKPEAVGDVVSRPRVMAIEASPLNAGKLHRAALTRGQGDDIARTS
ncbi:MAG: class I SAM-dependent methyltransferase [Chloroflexota bacterium]|nr:class I SAM-dependent methyltransferase [Chloroflexota bacterium]